MIILRRAKAQDAALLAPLLRAQDRAELAALGYKDAAEGLRECVQVSTAAWCALDGAEPLALFGLRAQSALGPQALAWCLTGSGVERNKKTFLRFSRHASEAFLKLYPCVYAWTDARYTRAQKWLERLGGRRGARARLGVNGEHFIIYSFRRKDHGNGNGNR